MRILTVLFCLFSTAAFSQTLGGASAYSFLRLPASPLVTAAGGANVSNSSGEVSPTAANPAFLQPNLHSQLNAAFTALPGNTRGYALTGAWHSEAWRTTFGAHVYFVDYGSLPQTDAAGNQSGEFRPRDFVAQVSAAKKYLEKWTYGGSLKFIRSAYGPYSSSAVAVDIGLLYTDSANLFAAGLVAKNMGAQLSTFAGQAEDLPFDLQVGFTKRLRNAPFGFSVTAQHLHRFDLRYNDASFNYENGFSPPAALDKIFNHFVVASQVYLGQNLEVLVGYNHLRRQDLSVPGAANGLTGFSAGLQARFSKLQIQLARAAYQRGVSYNQLGITVALNKLGGLGK